MTLPEMANHLTTGQLTLLVVFALWSGAALQHLWEAITENA